MVFRQKLLRFTWSHCFRRPFVVQNVANAELVFDEDRGVERNLVPVGQGIAGFYAKSPFLGSPTKVFNRILNGHSEAVRETEFDLLGQQMIGTIEAKRIPLVNQSCIDSARWQNIGIG